MPFYMLPLVYNPAPQLTLSGLGGSRTIRGILRNRVVGEDFVYGNIELRWKVARTVLFNQNLYLALSAYADAGMITGKYDLPEISDPEGIAMLARGEKEEMHTNLIKSHVLVLQKYIEKPLLINQRKFDIRV